LSKKYLILVGKKWYYKRRVPEEFRKFDKREFVRISLKTDSYTQALKQVGAVDRATEEYWNTIEYSQSDDAQKQYQAAIKMARQMGLQYKESVDVAELPLNQIIHRLKLADQNKDDDAKIAAALGGIKKPDLTWISAEKRFVELVPEKLRNKNKDQARRWRNPRKKAVKNLVSVIGDKPLAETTRDDALVFRDWWYSRIIDEGLTENSANKDIGHIRQIYNTIKDRLRLPLPPDPFERLSFTEERASQRKPFSREFVQETLIDGNALSKLNPQAKALIWVMASTGARVGEVCGLLPEDIDLEASQPHIKIRRNSVRTLKTKYSERDIPLCGSALLALREFPRGLDKYQGKSDSCSTEINKFLRGMLIVTDPDLSLYSLRHTFQDKLVALECGDRVQCDLMGHKFNRPDYGAGATLEHKAEWVERCAFYPASPQP
jgi:integrase